MAIDKIITAITPLKSVEKINEIIEEINNKNTGSGLSIGTIFPCVCSANWTPENALAVDGAEYSSTQFLTLWTDFLTATTPKLATCTYSEYASDIETYGQCAKFAVDTENNKFKVPTIKDGSYITQAMSDSEIGKAYNESLPNITGAIRVGSHGYTQDTITKGAFEVDENSSDCINLTGGNIRFNNAKFDASRSSSTYQDNAKVQGDNVRLRWFVVVATGTTSQSAMDWSAWATSLTGKANADLSNVSPVQDFKTSSISWGMPDYSAGVDYANNTTVNTAPSNGVLVISYYVSALTTGYFKINGQNIASSYHNAAYATTVTGQYMLSKGDTFQITSVAMASTSVPFIYRFYPCKGAN